MKIDINDIAYWMDAIRNEGNHKRYHMLESFWHGQLQSKVWLCEKLSKVEHSLGNRIVIFGGWYGVLATMLFNSQVGIRHITSVDIDPECLDIAIGMNRLYFNKNKFKAETGDMCDYVYNPKEHPHIVINTSCEHITQKQYEIWLDKVDSDTWIVLQSNNFTGHKEHINCSDSLKDFKWKSKLNRVWYEGTLELPKYDRYMLIGRK